MIRIQQLKLRPNHTKEQLEAALEKQLRMKASDFTYTVRKRSIDARKKPDLYMVYTVDVKVAGEEKVLKRLKGKNQIRQVSEVRYALPASTLPDQAKVVVVGSGPAGMFCALALARAGVKVLVIERGESVTERKAQVEQFWKTGELNPNCNVQFGEGGAGTFSDGKLNTGIKDPNGRIRYVLEDFVRFGADPDILVDAHPHVGTDVLETVVAQIRREIASLGGEYRFHTTFKGLEKRAEGWLLTLEDTEKNETYREEASHCVLAIGHSARDTFTMLHENGYVLTPKSFAMGLRIQHPQSLIDEALYGKDAADKWKLPPSPYKLTHRLADGGGVYSFCMCPGGYVVNASSEEGRTAVNGMSYHDRASGNANSAIVVTVPKESFADPSPLGGMYLQRELEEKAYQAGSGNIPVQTFGDYCAHKSSTGEGRFSPKIRGAYTYGDVRSILPTYIGDAIEEGVRSFERQIPGFADADALLCGIESRTSSPVRIERTETKEAVGHRGLYPCGEGAGYAGGITSAAVDGLVVAEAILTSQR